LKGITSILHISDLHRTSDGKIKNAGLLASLINDLDKYTNHESPRVKSPSLIIVSGDIIQGSVKTTDAEAEIEQQYAEAVEFLNNLATYFLNGDISKIIVMPGNHDIDWRCSKSSMVKIERENTSESSEKVKNNLSKELINKNSKIRWSWGDLSFYEIIDENNYNGRLEAFSRFYSTFYKGKRLYTLNPEEQFDIFDYSDLNLTVVAFNSCFNNDHLRLVGDINSECIAKVSMILREKVKDGRLILGAWHHNTKGGPYDSTYMDNSKLKNFIESNISLGFHGHQHKTELIHDYSNAIEQKRILVFSAGTLCAGPEELPTGNNRQYNLVELNWDVSDSDIIVTLHVREKSESSNFENPIWQPGRIDSVLVSHISLRIPKPKQPLIDFVLLEIEDWIRKKNFIEAKKRLLDLDFNNEFVRTFLLECIIETEDFELAFKMFQDPRTDVEIIALLNAVKIDQNRSKRKHVLELAEKFRTSSSNVRELILVIEALNV
jgi:3',5'-cyclic AMP phosphodiesterase CpdA